MEHQTVIAETDRLIKKKKKKEDLQDLFAYLSDAEVVKYEPHRPLTLEETEEALQWRMGTEEMIAVELKDSHRLIGNVYMGKREFETVELGFVFHRSYWGHGYAAESCRALIQQAFSKGVHRICAECDPRNERSWRLLEALGFQREGHLRQNVYFWKDEAGAPLWKDTYLYAELNDAAAARYGPGDGPGAGLSAVRLS